ncbi:hypothetical protein Gotur_008132 [Gossypium turneri]
MSNAVIWMGGEGIEGIPVVCRHSTPQVGLFSFYSASGNKMREPMGIHSNAVAAPPQLLLERLKDYGQEDAFALWDELSPEERHLLLNDIQNRSDHSLLASIPGCVYTNKSLLLIYFGYFFNMILSSCWPLRLPVAAIEPVPESWVSSVDERTMEHRERWWKMGLKAVSEGKLAVLLLSGGQVLLPVELYSMSLVDVGLPSGKSLFQLQAERILCVQRLAAQAMNEGSVTIHWYIMTSPFTDDAAGKFFESQKYFGLEADQVTFFQQGTIPCISKDGRYVMETPFKWQSRECLFSRQFAKSPDGNGGVYTALKSSRLLEDMATRGNKYVHCYGVDIALVRVADPTFLGYFIDKGVAAAAKVVRKARKQKIRKRDLSDLQLMAYPQEKVGVFVRRGKGGPLTVVEYTELDQSLASAVNQQTGRLRFCWSNDVNVYICLDYSYHLAEKKIPSIHGYTMGLKLEQFIFDAFPYAPSTALFEVITFLTLQLIFFVVVERYIFFTVYGNCIRGLITHLILCVSKYVGIARGRVCTSENANGSNYDTPDSARLLVLRLHTRWVVAAGAS